MKPDLIISHAGCQDGQGAAWALWAKWPDVPIVFAQYGDAPPDVTSKHVLMVDFSFKKPVLEAMAERARSITVLDHHKSAEEDLADFAVKQLRSPGSVEFHADQRTGLRIQALFDMTKSGARLAWEYANPHIPPPMIIRMVEDRDLWKFSIDSTREVSAFLFSHPHLMDDWKLYAKQIEDPAGRSQIILQGAAILRDRARLIRDVLSATTRSMVIGGYDVPVANMPHLMASDAGHILSQGKPFAATYFDAPDGTRRFSMRGDGVVDVSEIAVGYGGGGHRAAAGFSAPLGWEGERVDVDAIALSGSAGGVSVVEEEIIQ